MGGAAGLPTLDGSQDNILRHPAFIIARILETLGQGRHLSRCLDIYVGGYVFGGLFLWIFCWWIFFVGGYLFRGYFLVDIFLVDFFCWWIIFRGYFICWWIFFLCISLLVDIKTFLGKCWTAMGWRLRHTVLNTVPRLFSVIQQL